MTKKKAIHIKGARTNNLKNISIDLPYNQLIVVTGVSGSGKSSLIIDTLYAEGQRRYVESLSAYARQFLMRMKKPELDTIEGLCPAIAIEQKAGNKNLRSTVGTLTEIYDYLRLLFARVGRTFSPLSGKEVKKHTVSNVVDYLLQLDKGSKAMLSAPFVRDEAQTLAKTLAFLLQKGFTRVFYRGGLEKIDHLLEKEELVEEQGDVDVLIDRFVIDPDNEDNNKRIADSVQIAFEQGHGICYVRVPNKAPQRFSNRFELDGIVFETPSPQLFNFNSSFGACPDCEGYGKTIGIDEEKVIPDSSKSLLGDMVACWRGEKVGKWKQALLNLADELDFPVHRPYRDLTENQRNILWNGHGHFKGINGFFADLESKLYKVQNRVLLARYRGKTSCQSCGGTRLRKEALYVKVSGKSIHELVELPIVDLAKYFNAIPLSASEHTIAKRLVFEIATRLQFMVDVGLSYLTLNRVAATLSGGEIQRIHLTRSLGSNLTSSLYILDEPSIGLHPRDTNRLVQILRQLRDLGNTVVVVEHEEEIIKNADFLIDVGPRAGLHGGEITFAGQYKDIYRKAPKSLTTQYMKGEMQIPIPKYRRSFTSALKLSGVRKNNLKNIDVTFPLGTLTVVTGVSGSGKTTLVQQILYPLLKGKMNQPHKEQPHLHASLEGNFHELSAVEFVNQQPIGKSSRSNPVTYVKAYDAIRKLYSNQQAAKIQGFEPKHFSFNVEGGRCEACKGEGEIVVSMQFLADVRLTCEECQGRRFRDEVLEVQYGGKSIYDVLQMTVDEALAFFEHRNDIATKLRPLQEVGLGYIRLGQSSTTLSGGEAQRVKLAAFLGREKTSRPTLFIFDEPSTGLHFHDIQKLLVAFHALVEAGHTVLVVEHNMEVIKSADYVIDLGKEGGEEGGRVLFQGTPEEMLEYTAESYTAFYLKKKMDELKK